MSKKAVKLISIILAVMMFLSILLGVMSYLFAYASIASDKAKLKDLQGQLAEVTAERKGLENELAALGEEKASLFEQKTTTEQQINATLEQIDITTEMINQLSLLIEERTKELEIAIANEEQQYESFKTRIRAMYENDSVSTLELILSSGSLTTVYAKLEAAEAIATYDKNLMKNLASTREYIAELKQGLEADREEQRGIKADYEQLERDLTTQTLELEKLIEEIQSQEEYTQADINEVIQAQKDFEKEIADVVAAIKKAEEEERRRKAAEEAKKREAARLAAEKAAAEKAAKNSSSSSYSGGSMLWPIPGYTTISSGYSMRNHPITGVYSQHTGIDMPAPKGTKVYAAADGTVVSVGYNKAYGNRVIISHGNGYQTLYGHFSRVSVKENQKVTTSTVVGLVGNTGQSTGNHLHFSVIKNGGYVNPTKYVSP
ncbi:MAG: peptidoglycan DD-metalloendopeptidase family protein [Clostridiales bacterium]|nr:peptidoglycan DD-metalloendopeptidase family protein [Clostridiales bacterium]